MTGVKRMFSSNFLKIISIPTLLYLLFLALYTLLASYTERNRIITDINQRLFIAAGQIKNILDPTFFDRATAMGAISDS